MKRHASWGSWAVLAAGLGLWWVASHAGWVHRAFVPTPEATVLSLWQGLWHGELAIQLGHTLGRMGLGWLLASLLAVGLGTLIASSRVARAWIGPSLELMRPLPASALLPLAVALFGLSPGMVLIVVAFGALWPVLLATVHGIESVPSALRELASALGMRRAAYLWHIALPHALPDILAGMRLSLAVALIVSVVGEMLASQSGLGQGILLAARTYRASELMAGIVLLSGVGIGCNLMLAQLERHLLRWQAR